MDTERKLCITMIDKFLNKKLSKPIEKCLFEYANDTKHKYMTKLKYIFEIINPDSCIYNKTVVNNIKKNKITPYELVNNNPWDIYIDHWKDIVEEQNKMIKLLLIKHRYLQLLNLRVLNVKIMNVKHIHYKHVVQMNLLQFL